MKKLIFFALVAFFGTAATMQAQDREANNPTIEVSGHNVSMDFKLPRFSYQSSSQDWKESEMRPVMGYGKFSYKGDDYVVVVIRSSVSRYKYPNIREGYTLTSLNGYAIFTEEGFDEFLAIDEDEKIISPIAYKSFSGIRINEPFNFDKAQLFEIEKVIDSKAGQGYISSTKIEPSSIKFQVKKWKDVARFNIPSNSNTAGESEQFGSTTDMSKAYYEIPYDDYVKYVQTIKDNAGPQEKGKKKK